jgi:glycosyltransferase involved in cell wall biosynthesis
LKNPLVSVIVPCYNQAQYLDECLQSVLEQTYENWECIIVNDESPDNTEKIVKQWLNRDLRFKYVFKENGGLSSARNSGISIARGEFILPLDADDKIGKNYLKLGISEFLNDEFLKVVYCRAEKFGIENGEWILKDFSLKLLAKDNMIFCSALYRKKDWELVMGYDANMIYGLEDWEFWIAILKNGGGVKKLNYLGFFYRIKTKSMIKDIEKSQKKKIFEYISVKHADFMVKELGSFMYLTSTIEKNNKNLTNEKFVFKLFLSTCLRYMKRKLKRN